MQALFKVSKNFFLQYIYICTYIYIYIYATVSGYTNKNISFYPKSLRPFLKILCVVDDYASPSSKEDAPRALASLAITCIHALI